MLPSTMPSLEEETIEWGLDAFQRSLDTLRPKIGDYRWIWKLLQFRARKTGYVPAKLYAALQRFIPREKPYFIGQTSDGTLFLGDTRDNYSVDSAVFPTYDTVLVQFIVDHLQKREGAYLDVGANMGVTTATVARACGTQSEVIAFEPVPETAKRAAATLALNELRNVRLFQAAIGDQDQEIPLFVSPGNSDSASADPRSQGSTEGLRIVCAQSYRLDSLMHAGRIPKVGILKLDVEGLEPRAIAGARDLIRTYRPGILFEYNRKVVNRLGWKAEEVVDAIRDIAPYAFHVLHREGQLTPFLDSVPDQRVVNIFGEPLDA